ncbi:MAG TPA: methyltransferase domain-containing protein [Schlesneria sp.]|jgi:SAM-dependent methyltransferase
MSDRALQLTRRLKSWISTQSRIADIGSGTGHNAAAWRRELDATVDEFDVADLHWVGDGPMIFDGRKLAVADASYSIVTLLFILQYAADPNGLLQEARRVSAGRVILIQSTYRGSWGYLWLRVREFVWGPVAFWVARFAGIVKGPSCSLKSRTLFTREQLAVLFRQTGLTVIHCEPENWPGMSISRDLYVLERAVTPSTSPSSSPLAMKSAG